MRQEYFWVRVNTTICLLIVNYGLLESLDPWKFKRKQRGHSVTPIEKINPHKRLKDHFVCGQKKFVEVFEKGK